MRASTLPRGLTCDAGTPPAVWADQWKRNSGCDQRCLLAFIQQWHVSHLAASKRLGACIGPADKCCVA